jgi:hypothetical protein
VSAEILPEMQAVVMNSVTDTPALMSAYRGLGMSDVTETCCVIT